MEEEVVKKVLCSFRTFLSETKLSSCASLSVDWDALPKNLPDCEEFNQQLTDLSSQLQSLKDKKDDKPSDSVNHSNDIISPTSITSIDDGSMFEDAKLDSQLDPMFVQISASNSEIERRIQAFIEKKQVEVDDNNRREFGTTGSSSSITQEESSCARTDAIFKCHSGWRGHVKVSKVVNVQGPQTRPAMIHHLTSLIQSPPKSSLSHQPAKSMLSSSHHSGMEERLRNMESHLKVRRGQGSSDIYERIKNLENRILHLESVSPEYMDVVHTFNKRRRIDMGSPGNQEFSIKEIDHKIEQLQNSLLKRRLDVSQDPSTSTSG